MGDGYAFAEASDAELLRRLRSGETEAYTELWRRHVRAALRLGHRLTPGSAEDLVSESFLAVYRQVTTTGSGPKDSFRAYLFTVMRNTAARWQRDGRLVETDPELDEVETEDGLRRVEDRAESAELLSAFEALPERWQRILWLSEVEEASRTEIAAELGIKPNAVSSLHRRARTGLRLQWLTQQVPVALREDPEHIARLLPALIVDRRSGGPTREMRRHLERCPACAGVQADLSSASRNMGRGTLAVAGFAALGVSLPAAANVPIAASGTAALLAWAGGTGTALAAGIGVLLAGGALTAAVLAGLPQSGGSAPEGDGGPARQSAPDGSGTDAPGSTASAEKPATDGSDAAAPGTALGRGNTDESVPVLTLGTDDGFAPPPRPDPPLPSAPGTNPGPATGGPGTGGPGTGSPELTPGLDSRPETAGYFAPSLAGTATPASTVVVAVREGTVGETQYTVTPDADGGWSMDLRDLDLWPGDYSYAVWAVLDGRSSSATEGAFTITPVGIVGFEGIGEMPLTESATTGVVVRFVGPPNETMFIADSPSGQFALVPLDANGEAIRRMRFFGAGTHFLGFVAYAEGYGGGNVQRALTIVDDTGGVFGPWSGADGGFEISEP